MPRGYSDDDLRILSAKLADFGDDLTGYAEWKAAYERAHDIQAAVQRQQLVTTFDLWQHLGDDARPSRHAKPITDRVAHALNPSAQFHVSQRDRDNDRRMRAMTQQTAGTVMLAKFPGRCFDCGQPINVGDEIRFDGKAHHAPFCPPPVNTSDPEDDANEHSYDAAIAQRDREDQNRADAFSLTFNFSDTLNAPPASRAGAVDVREGTFTVVAGDERRTFRIRRQPEDRDFMPGKLLLSMLTGPDNETSYKSIGMFSNGKIVLWKAYRENAALRAMAEVLLDPTKAEEAGFAYAVESGNCFRCGRKLTVPASIHRGMGPVCAQGGRD